MFLGLGEGLAHLVGHPAFYGQGKQLLLFGYLFKFHLLEPVFGHEQRDLQLALHRLLSA